MLLRSTVASPVLPGTCRRMAGKLEPTTFPSGELLLCVSELLELLPILSLINTGSPRLAEGKNWLSSDEPRRAPHTNAIADPCPCMQCIAFSSTVQRERSPFDSLIEPHHLAAFALSYSTSVSTLIRGQKTSYRRRFWTAWLVSRAKLKFCRAPAVGRVTRKFGALSRQNRVPLSSSPLEAWCSRRVSAGLLW